jgi:hypothetical protein
LQITFVEKEGEVVSGIYAGDVVIVIRRPNMQYALSTAQSCLRISAKQKQKLEYGHHKRKRQTNGNPCPLPDTPCYSCVLQPATCWLGESWELGAGSWELVFALPINLPWLGSYHTRPPDQDSEIVAEFGVCKQSCWRLLVKEEKKQ